MTIIDISHGVDSSEGEPKMSNMTATQVHIAVSVPQLSFQIDGQVVEVLPGSGLATIVTNSMGDFAVSRGTKGLHFEELCVGDWINCQVTFDGSRVLYAHQQTQTIPTPVKAQLDRVLDAPFQARPRPSRLGSLDSKRRSMTREEFIAEYCRRWGVTWADLSRYRVPVPSNDTMGWTMARIDCHEDEETVAGSLEPLRN